ncbi:hypothetical protein [Sunxiuqinia sp. sy24]|uniref:hypothetical protein n=1 Tax=Sunxiuqinia sp. sy24 TaxID=3461495 RepID=UPI004045CE5A
MLKQSFFVLIKHVKNWSLVAKTSALLMRKPEDLDDLTLTQLRAFVASTSPEQSFIAHLILSNVQLKSTISQ